ncbi:hypothetical protein ARZXY2_1090 [Arthrobacter sp. ZXY-2]|nr:hypothetical protein ARZXY2_1090 [Arthrobacter sp. ZXY-2]
MHFFDSGWGEGPRILGWERKRDQRVSSLLCPSLGIGRKADTLNASPFHVKLFGITVPVLGRTAVCATLASRSALLGEAVHMGKIEPSCGSKQSAKEHNPAGPPQIIQSPAYQTPDNDPANDVAEDRDAGVVSAVVRGFRRVTGVMGNG